MLLTSPFDLLLVSSCASAHADVRPNTTTHNNKRVHLFLIEFLLCAHGRRGLCMHTNPQISCSLRRWSCRHYASAPKVISSQGAGNKENHRSWACQLRTRSSEVEDWSEVERATSVRLPSGRIAITIESAGKLMSSVGAEISSLSPTSRTATSKSLSLC